MTENRMDQHPWITKHLGFRLVDSKVWNNLMEKYSKQMEEREAKASDAIPQNCSLALFQNLHRDRVMITDFLDLIDQDQSVNDTLHESFIDDVLQPFSHSKTPLLKKPPQEKNGCNCCNIL